MTATTIHDQSPAAGWLRGLPFDLQFIVGIAAIALLSGAVVVMEPRLFVPILLIDLWLLGYHHVISTYTRLCFDRESFRAHRFLLLGLPLIVIAAVAGAVFGIGLWTLATVYLYWQWFHYTRQSWGVSQVYRRKAGDLIPPDERIGQVAFYLLPLWGILYRSHQDPGTFLGMELRVIPVPELAVHIVGVAALAALGWWLATRVAMWRRGRLPVAHTIYMLSHFVIFAFAYLIIESIDAGWLVVNVWHNAQYIVFVWLFNNNRFKEGVDPKAKFLSTISQTRNAWLYIGVCLAISTAAYLAIDTVFSALALVPLVAIYMTINFHHYIVDSLIWKVRRKPIQKVLGITS
ncbi:MAG: hypothetical protein QNJ67_08605 [Kiloniellales bacterium]|nr:hypothetical protein [Kiloniellales bacterium]